MNAVLAAEQDRVREALAAARGTVLDLRSHLSDLRAAQDFLRISQEAAASEAREAKNRASAALAELAALRAHCDALLAERDWLRNVRDTQQARLQELEPIAREATQAMLEQAGHVVDRDALTRRAASLDRLARDLRWEDGPRALQAVLPLARLLRRVRG